MCEWCGAIICASTSAWQLPTHAHYASTATRPAAADRYSLHGTRRTGRPIWASPKNGGRGGRPHNGQVVGGHILPQGVCTQVQVSSSCQGMQRKKRFLSVGHICKFFIAFANKSTNNFFFLLFLFYSFSFNIIFSNFPLFILLLFFQSSCVISPCLWPILPN